MMKKGLGPHSTFHADVAIFGGQITHRDAT
jgi:hypothetical protein